MPQPLRVCEVLHDLDRLNGRTVSIVGYLDGGTLHGLFLRDDDWLKPCAEGSLYWFRWPGALGISLVPTVPAGLLGLLDGSGMASGAKVKVKATIKTKLWGYIFCIRGSCISNGYAGRFAGGLQLLEITCRSTKNYFTSSSRTTTIRVGLVGWLPQCEQQGNDGWVFNLVLVARRC